MIVLRNEFLKKGYKMALTNAERQQKFRDERKLQKEKDDYYVQFLRERYAGKTAKELVALSMPYWDSVLVGKKLNPVYDKIVIERLDYLRLVVFGNFDTEVHKSNIFKLLRR